VLIIQNILVSVLGGITISDYMMNNKRKNPWLLIFGLLSVTLYFIVFIEKYYLSDLSPGIFRPMAMILNTMVYYTFYKFVIETERSNDN
jgi:nicotinamide riboside transporter PnuC